MNYKHSYNMQSRGYKTKGYEYKDRYVDDKVCPECGGTSIYKDEWNTIISYKCIKRSCRYNWFENKNKINEPRLHENKFELVKLNEAEKKRQDRRKEVNDFLMNYDLGNKDRIDNTLYSLIGHYDTDMTRVLGNHMTFEQATQIAQKTKGTYDSYDIIEEKMIATIPSNLYIISNAEGHYEETKELLYRPMHLRETFIFNGNFVGPKDFIKYMDYIQKFSTKRNCIFIRGKNEHNLLEYINGTEKYIGVNHEDFIFNFILPLEKEMNGQLKSLSSIYPKIFDIINNSKDYFENNTHIVVSGGVDLSIPFWKQSDKYHLYNTTDNFLENSNQSGKVIVFGDKPSDTIEPEKTTYGIWKNNRQNKVAINGNVSAGKKLIALSILNGETNYLTARNREEKKKRLLELYEPHEIEDMF